MSRLEQIQLIQSSLLPGEQLVFVEDSETWQALLDDTAVSATPSAASFQIRLDDFPHCSLDVVISHDLLPNISVKGLGRSDQEQWGNTIQEMFATHQDSEYPVYDVITQLVPLLREDLVSEEASLSTVSRAKALKPDSAAAQSAVLFHVLFTSHHLISPTKRRNLQSWASSLSISGFTKVGYPGLIYAQGQKDDVEEFTDNVKAMQWLALKVRFLEPLPHDLDASLLQRRWTEFQKVGKVVEEMKRLGRERFVVEMGIGSSGT